MTTTRPQGTETLEVLVVGDVMVDVIASMSGPFARDSDTPSRITTRGGGSGANVAAWLAHLGVRTTFVGCLGDDALGRAGLVALADAGMDVSRVVVDTELPTGTCVVLVEPGGERSMLPDPGANDALVPGDLIGSLFRPGRHLHLSGYTLLRDGSRDAGLVALTRALEVGMTVSVDPSSAALLDEAGAPAFLQWTQGASLLFPNAHEALALTRTSTVTQAAAELATSYGEVVVTLGHQGAMWQNGFISATAAAERVMDVVDTTGAGDAFAAGFLASWLLHPEPETALAYGNRLAARAIGKVGARP
jgi:sugar/nucleoside kinase (ribokinase family)